ncbi:unnamed protein product [Brassica napus]|uniref:(rape) hypothetical protein n=1 Tax=Brassica napus TaxID=3708 RepID=A0A816QF99_BRANA|nr:unnamed protein product [Brassica napus]
MGITLLFLDEKFYGCEDPISTINIVFHPQKLRTKETTNQLREPDSKRLIDVIAANGVLFIMAALRIERPLSSYAQGQLLAFIQRMDGPKLQCWSLRYRVQMTVSLASDSAEFVAFDSDISKLTNIRAAEISQQMKTQVSETPQSWALPQCIEGIVGRTFQLKFSRLKFLYKHQSFTVSRIYDTHRCRPQPVLRTKVVITTLVMICLVVELLKYAIQLRTEGTWTLDATLLMGMLLGKHLLQMDEMRHL